MPKYVIFFGITSDALARFIDRPEDRRGPVRAIAEAVGGTARQVLLDVWPV